ncbi:MAG: cobalt-precorrin-7 (C(5))-methyltransferase [Euryarchaeota archaeon]|nr:cobalt-precorrin-7 (C(5))-methyltransferase [Euryarchaeota archaeon]MBV1728927.1 cobalt-precorrin-7 (C(5))-methyltransferase [Methanobacterium sp.]MBU4547522.1 cobalt-precorrin-7 (C(5))-methyltransferase [Euryarchaeota archaeon]MBU4608247.1 cobalt-precorrin-7 (C(5))-methyltransferase [Euryarchaeota archaeon]MBV1755236.1 cobalt-precorrin-7 (C(5))-methyltransferase [Methanobacterium sp.]
MSKLYIAGIGPGSEDFVTPAARKVVKASEITIGSKRAVDLFPESREVVLLNVKDVQEKLEYGVDMVRGGKNVCILSTGDPGFSGVLSPVKRIIEEKGYEGIELEVVPGISSLQLCAARVEIPWDDADLMTFHGRENFQEILPILDNGRPTITLPSRSTADMANFLMDNGISPDRKVIVCERLSYPEEKVVEMALKEVAESEFTYMCVMVIY